MKNKTTAIAVVLIVLFLVFLPECPI